MATRTDIIAKTYKCLDEVYPDTPLSSDIDEFHIEDFVDDAIRFIGRVAPVRALGEGTSFIPEAPKAEGEGAATTTTTTASDLYLRINPVPPKAEGEGAATTTTTTASDLYLRINPVPLSPGFVRLIAFQMSDWALPVTDALYSDSPRYQQQADPILMGTTKRPVVFVCDGGKNLEYYSSTGTIKKAQAFIVGADNYPEALADVIAWKTAEMVLSVMNDAQAVQFAQAQLKQLFEAL